jgi:ATP-grasp domain
MTLESPLLFGTSKVSSPSHYLIQDPYHEYGAQFIDHIYRTYGHRAICIYTNRRERMIHEAQFPQLRSDAVAAAYDVNLNRLADFAAAMAKSRHDIIAVIPFNETSVLPATTIAHFLELSWAQPNIMPLFRNKFALKDHLRKEYPGLRMNASRLVQTTRDVLSIRGQREYRRFVIKPNDGYGNRDIALFDRESTKREVDAYVGRLKHSELVMEEYIDGTEYFVNGQIDAGGDASTVAIFQYSRRPANGRHNIDFETSRVSYGTPLFDNLARYAENVMRATGLRRCPFHLELKVDELGPCLIEAAARLPGHGNALLSGELHGPGLDLIDLACHYYFKPEYRELPLDWAAYNSQAVRYVHGVAHRPERICELEGIEEVEALPEFHSWVKKPVIGTRIPRTVDCLSMPWCVVLKAATEPQVAEAAISVRQLIQWNRHVGSVRQAALSVKFKIPRVVKLIQREIRMTLPPLHPSNGALYAANRPDGTYQNRGARR